MIVVDFAVFISFTNLHGARIVLQLDNAFAHFCETFVTFDSFCCLTSLNQHVLKNKYALERFSLDCRKTKTQVNTLANQKGVVKPKPITFDSQVKTALFSKSNYQWPITKPTLFDLAAN